MAGKVLTLADVMHTDIHMVDALSSVADAVAQMQRLRVSSLVVDRRGEDDEYGVVTIHDIATKVLAQSRPARRISVYEVMVKPVLTLHPTMNVKYGIRILTRLGLSRSLVARDTELVGLVTLRDLVVFYVEEADSGA